MPRYVVFWGHGRWSPDESPAKATVPTGCDLMVFARHREMIDVRRKHSIVGLLDRWGRDVSEVVRWAKLNAALRRIKYAGEDIHNCRLYFYDDTMGIHPNVDGLCEVVTAAPNHPDGETLADLMRRHGRPGVTMRWVPVGR